MSTNNEVQNHRQGGAGRDAYFHFQADLEEHYDGQRNADRGRRQSEKSRQLGSNSGKSRTEAAMKKSVGNTGSHRAAGGLKRTSDRNGQQRAASGVRKQSTDGAQRHQRAAGTAGYESAAARVRKDRTEGTTGHQRDTSARQSAAGRMAGTSGTGTRRTAAGTSGTGTRRTTAGTSGIGTRRTTAGTSGIGTHRTAAASTDTRRASTGRVGKKAPIQVNGIKNMVHIFLFPVVYIYFEIVLRVFGKTGVFDNLIYPILFGIATGLICTCITSLFPKKINKVITIVLLFAVGLLFTVECLIKSSYQVYMTPKAVMTGAGGVVGGFASDLFITILHGIPVIILFFLPGVLYILLGRKKLPAVHYRLAFVGLIFVGALLIMGITVFSATHGRSKEKYQSQFEFNTATQTFGLLTSVRLSTKYAIFGNKQAEVFFMDNTTTGAAAADSSTVGTDDSSAVESDTGETETADYGDNVLDLNLDTLIANTSDDTLKSMHTYVNSLTPTNKNKYTGLFKGKNLILICAEAFSDSVISEELTPTLYRLVHNGIYFSDYYQPTWGGSTSTGEYSFLMGLVPLNGVDTMVKDTRGKNLYYTLGNQLMKQGYFSRCYHNGEYDFYERNATHENLGYEKFLATGNGLEDITDWYPSDTTMFDKTLDTYMDQQPFSIYYMTVSGHCKYVSDKSYVTEYLDKVLEVTGGKYKDTTNYYLCYQMELENALKTMVEKLEAAGIADDTVICMTADHYPYGLENGAFGNTDDYVTDLYGYKYTNGWEQDHNTLVLWSGCLENANKDMACEIAAPTYSLDVVPTLLNLFGLDYDSRLLVGRDVFSDAEPIVLWNNYSWLTEKGKYNSATATFEPNEGVTVDDAYVERIKAIVSNKISFSDQVLRQNYYQVLFGGGS